MLCNYQGHNRKDHENLQVGIASKTQFQKLGILSVGLFLILLSINFVSAELNYTTGEVVYGIMADGTKTGALNITFQIKSCDDFVCFGETFVGPDNTSSTYFTNATYNLLNETLSPNNTYFQYKTFFSTEDQNYSSMLFNVTIGYNYIDETEPLISFENPTPPNNSGRSSEFEINVSIKEQYLANVTYNWNGTNTTFYIGDALLIMNFDNISSLGENDTHIVDASRQGNNGTVYGAVWNSTGKYGGTYDFDGVNDSIKINSGNCPTGMAYINKLNGYCIDQYEASMPSANSTDMGNITEVDNRNNPGSMAAESKVGVVPWVRINQINSRTACENAGKHLCSDEEWLAAANVQGQVFNLPSDLRVSPYYCVTSSSTYCLDHSYESGEACNTGNKTGCVSSEGVYDMVGNVWEWTNETVDITNPNSFADWYYINTTDTTWSNESSVDDGTYGKDGIYFPLTTTGRAVLRGGGWYNGANAGPFCAYLYNAPPVTYHFIGFRCCSS